MKTTDNELSALGNSNIYKTIQYRYNSKYHQIHEIEIKCSPRFIEYYELENTYLCY